MRRPANGDPTIPDSSLADRTNAVDFARPPLWRVLATFAAAGALFSVAFFGAYLLTRGSPAPAAPQQSTWQGTAVAVVSETTPDVVDPISPAVALPTLHVTTSRPAVVKSTRQHTVPVSGMTTHSTTTPKTKTTQQTKIRTTQNTTTDGLITVTN
jgi:hypothetical protein